MAGNTLKTFLSPLTLTYLVGLLVLTALTLKDLTQNITDYIYANRVTRNSLVTPVDGDYPFLPNFTVYLFWKTQIALNWSYIEDYLSEDDLTNSSFVGDHIITKVAGCGTFWDNKALVNKIDGTDCNSKLPGIYMQTSGFSEKVERVLTDLKRQLRLNESWADTYPVDSLGVTNVAVTLNLHHHFQQTKISFFNDVVGQRMEQTYCFGDTRKSAPKSVGRIMLRDSVFPYRYGLIDRFLTNTLRATVRVSTSGILSVYGDCDHHVNSDESAIFKCELAAIVETCKCVPFRYRRQVKWQRNFCTDSIYDVCLTKDAKQKIVTKCRTSKACMNSNPSYMVTYQNGLDKCQNASVELTVLCSSRPYLLLKEQPLTTWSQLLAQIGGNLGLYLGLSFVSVFNFSVGLWRLWRQSDASATSTCRRKSTGSRVGVLLRTLSEIPRGKRVFKKRSWLSPFESRTTTGRNIL